MRTACIRTSLSIGRDCAAFATVPLTIPNEPRLRAVLPVSADSILFVDRPGPAEHIAISECHAHWQDWLIAAVIRRLSA